MIDPRQRFLMELARNPAARISEPPAGEQWREAAGEIRSCGDTVTLYLEVKEDTISGARYRAAACALSLASAELLCRTVIGLNVAEAHRLLERWHNYLSGESDESPEDPGALDRLAIVREFPARKGCVLLPLDCATRLLDSVGCP